MNPRKPDFLHKCQRFAVLLRCFAYKARNDIRRDRNIVKRFPQQPDSPAVIIG